MTDSSLKVLDGQQTEALLPYPGLADAIEASLSRGDIVAPLRSSTPTGAGGQLLAMPASDDEIGMIKVVTVHPGNSAKGLPTIQGEMIVFNAQTGERLGLLDGATVSGRRTAALSLLAARNLAPSPAAPVLIVGAGTQARTHLDAFIDGLGTRKVYISSRSPEPALKLAEYARGREVTAMVVDRPEEAFDDARIIATTTTSQTPVLPDELPSGTFVAAVGAFRPEMAELSPQLIGRSEVVVDTLDGAREEAGGLIQAHEAGTLEWQDVHELADIVSGRHHVTGESVIFKSVGTSQWDLAAAHMAFARQ